MRFSVLFLTISVLLLSSCVKTDDKISFTPSNNLTQLEMETLLYELVRYYGRLPAKATHETKYDEQFDDEYQITIDLHRIDFYYHNEITGYEYLLLSRPARSLYHRRVAIGIEFKRQEDQLKYYYEHFRTWRMDPDELSKKSEMLFSRMVNGLSLEAFYPENSGDSVYIEFPNADTFFDPNSRTWRPVSGSPLEELLNSTNRL